jgi:uncharacterized membrane protein YheB (UPF0754 family)
MVHEMHLFTAQPFGIFGWQGVVPAKRHTMAGKVVDVTISKLIRISDLFKQLKPSQLSKFITPLISKHVFYYLLPRPIVTLFTRKIVKNIISDIEKIINIKSIVVTGLTANPKTLGSFFQNIAEKELKFLIDSGFGFGFLLGIFQMIQWMMFPYNWTLIAGMS